MRILVCGGRHFTDKELLFEVLDLFYKKHGPLVIIEGGAMGADYFARQWVRQRQKLGWDVQGITVPANWRMHGKSAGPIRNQQMLDEHYPDKVVAFRGQKGTADMVARAHKAGVPVYDLREVGAIPYDCLVG